MPPSKKLKSPPSASNLRSPGASKVTSVAPFNTKSRTVVPPSFMVILAPSASSIMSVVASNVIVDPESISAITGVVKVLLVKVCVAAIPVSVSVEAGNVKVTLPEKAECAGA